MALDELRPVPLVDQAVQRLRDHIGEGHWPVGTKLPGETTLAQTLGVGRSTVREAVRALSGAGMVQARHGVGVFVTATAPREELTDKLREALIADLYEVRCLIEVEAARLAAARRNAADIEALYEALQLRRVAVSNAEFIDADIALHARVVQSAHNPVLNALFAEFIPTLRRGLIELVERSGLRESDPNPGDHAHSQLVDAIQAGAPELAAQILQDELTQTLADLRAQGWSR
ncbi:GntR family transcriptional regulator [Rhodococcus sp. SRB_17]|nr:GntR family transcriptional regulator [Rhodococcus sp. SRB_17]